MQCRNCQYPLPPRAQFCSRCFSPTPYNVESAASPDPTIQASSTGQGAEPTIYAPPPASNIAPTQFASPPNQGGGPGPAAPPPPAIPYGTPPPPLNAYGVPQPTPYGVPPTPYGMPPAPGAIPYPPLYPQPKKKNSTLLIVGLALVICCFLCAGIIATSVLVSKNEASSHNATALASMQTVNAQTPTPVTNDTPTVGTTPATDNVPSTSQIDPTAASHIPSAITASGVDANGRPIITSSFTRGSTVYVGVSFSNPPGYAMVKIYRNGSFDVASQILAVKPDIVRGDFPFIIRRTGQFVGGVYWCNQSNCSDAALAQVVNFTTS